MVPRTGPKWHRFPALGRQEQRERYCPEFLLSLLHVHLSGVREEELGWKSSAGAAKEAELGDVEEIGDQASSPVKTGNFLGIKQQEIRAFTAVSK